jgi:tetratricopeptide (TPR) repeat protein
MRPLVFTLVLVLSATVARADPHSDCDQSADPDRQISGCTSVIETDPKHVKAYLNRGTAYYKKSDFDRAIADFTKTIELRPNPAADYINRGVAFAVKGDKNRASADFRKALEIDPSNEGAKKGLEMLGMTP